MSKKALINLTALDFFEIKENLKNFLKNQNEFKDYNFEGSGLSVLLDLLAYNAQHNAYLANMLANEAEIDSAILRSNVVSRAKLLGYTPKSHTAAKAVISISIDDPNRNSTSLLLPRGTKFVASFKNQSYIFVTLSEYNLYLDNDGKYKNDEIEIFEGSIRAFSFDVDSYDKRFIIPSKKIDTKTLKIAVFENPTSNNFEIYEQVNGIAKINSNSKVFWVYETDNNYYEIKFGDGVFGKRPPINSLIYCEFLETNGPLGNNFSNFSLVGTFEGYENTDIEIRTITPSTGGSEIESIESIKINAPRFFQSQGRAITKEDYISVVNEIYPYAKSVAVWGGDELNPKQYGKVFISIIPRDLVKLTSSTKRSLEQKIKTKTVAGITPIIVDPKFIKLNMTVYVTVRKNMIQGLGDFGNRILNLVKTYFDDTFGIFDSDFYYSNLIAEIKNFSKAIVGVKANYTLSLVNDLKDSVFAFENKIVPGTVRSNKIRLTGQTSFHSIEDKKADGKLFVDEMQIGTVDYESGKIIIKTELIQESTLKDFLEIFVTPLDDDVFAGFASALILDKDRLSIELRSA